MAQVKGILREFKERLAQFANHTLTSKGFAEWSDEQYWNLMEGSGKDDETRSAKFLREVLYDVAAQWECLVAEFHSTNIEFSEELITDWFSQVRQFIETDEELGEYLLVEK